MSAAWNRFTHFYPRSPCGERLCGCWMVPGRLLFLSTLSLRRATASHSKDIDQPEHFYPRSPCGERRLHLSITIIELDISIHALLAESDSITITITCTVSKFLSTLSLRRATAWHRFTMRRDFISIHALLAESDSARSGCCFSFA